MLVLLGVGLVACNTGESDAARVMRANSEGTIAAMNNRMQTMEATNAAFETVVAERDTFKSMLDDEKARNQQLINQQNQNIGVTNPVQPGQPGQPQPTQPASFGGDPGIIPTPAPSVSAPVATSSNPNAFAIERITTARSVDNGGCAVTEATTFNTTDARIYVVAYVRNLKTNTPFKSVWQVGGDPKEFSYTPRGGLARTCVNFYIEPRTLEIQPGDYSVTVSAGTDISGGASFKVEGQPISPATAAP
jgi:hypothetical protein